jgi:hypothetical protein
VIVAGERVANVVQQRAHHVLLIFAVEVRQGRCLQAMGQPVYGETTVVTTQQAQVVKQAIG